MALSPGAVRAGAEAPARPAARIGAVPVAAAEIELSAAQARRAAIAAQGLTAARPRGRVDVRHLRRALDALGIVQLDSVNVFSRSHYMPLFSRLGPYPRETLDQLTVHQDGPTGEARADRRELFEYWGHEASLIPVDMQPLLRWRMARADDLAWARGGADRQATSRSWSSGCWSWSASRGRSAPREVGGPKRARQAGEMWNWNEGKKALEYLFFAGQVTAERRVNFERLYDLPERVLPAAVLEMPTPPEDEAQRELLLIAARRLGVATEPDLGDYFRLPRADSKARLAELVEAGALRAGRGRGLGRARLRAARPRGAAADPGARPAHPVRLDGLGARAHRAALRLPLPDRDLRPGAEARLRLLRPPLPARRPAGRPGRPEKRPPGGGAAGGRRLRRAGGRRGPAWHASWPTNYGWSPNGWD